MPQTLAIALVMDAVRNAGPHDGLAGPSAACWNLGRLLTEQQPTFFKRAQYSIGQARPKPAGAVYTADIAAAIKDGEKDLAKDVHSIFKDANTFYFDLEQMTIMAGTLLRKYNPPAPHAAPAVVAAAAPKVTVSPSGASLWPAALACNSRAWCAPRLVGPSINAGKARAPFDAEPYLAGAGGTGGYLAGAGGGSGYLAGAGGGAGGGAGLPNMDADAITESRLTRDVTSAKALTRLTTAEHKTSTVEVCFRDAEIASLKDRLQYTNEHMVTLKTLLVEHEELAAELEATLKTKEEEAKQARAAEATTAAALAKAQTKLDEAQSVYAVFKRPRRS